MAKEQQECDQQCEQVWRAQVLPKFRAAHLSEQQTEAAHKMFKAGFESGWQAHQAMLTKEFIRESQKQKVHLA
jgi:formamidopyrimidine-DNA glycosylase